MTTIDSFVKRLDKIGIKVELVGNYPWLYLDKINASHHIHIYTGAGSYEDPEANRRFSQVLWDKNIWHDLDIWGEDINHDWPTWRAMLPYIIGNKF